MRRNTDALLCFIWGLGAIIWITNMALTGVTFLKALCFLLYFFCAVGYGLLPTSNKGDKV